MKSTKSTTSPDADLSPRAQLHRIFTDALDVNVLDESTSLESFREVDLIEALVAAERAFGLPETDEDAYLRCKTIGDLMALLTLVEVADAATA